LAIVLVGRIVDAVSWMLLLMPVVLPFLKALGVDLIWYGLLVVNSTRAAS
jgi:TRAP-type C4-dicarboxylate transport system permease large subunit